MKTSRIKSIVIVILALVNVFLLILLFGRQNQQRSSYERSVEQLSLLLADNGIAFDTALLPDKTPFPTAELTRDDGAEAAFAQALLGDASCIDAGSGTVAYENETGSFQFRSNGTVDGSMDRPVEDPVSFAGNILSPFGYRLDTSAVSTDGSGTVVAARETKDAPIFNAPLTLRFERSHLVSVSGSFLSSVTFTRSTNDTDVLSALVRFLDYRNANGLVCTKIAQLERGYLLQSTAASPKLIPAWHIMTDVSSYYVNSVTGEVTRE